MPIKKLKSVRADRDVLALATAVGDFIRYWGFRRIHGQIWTQLYLSKTPLSGTVLSQRIQVSKALVSPALTELVEFALIRVVGGDSKTKTYSANADVFSPIRKILNSREKLLIQRASRCCQRVEEIAQTQAKSDIDSERLLSLGSMISSAQAALELVVQLTEQDKVSDWLKL